MASLAATSTLVGLGARKPCTRLHGVLPLLVVAVATVGAFPYTLDEGERCMTASGMRGECRRLSECLPALDAVRWRREPPPLRCGFLGWEEVVCCPCDGGAGGAGAGGGGGKGEGRPRPVGTARPARTRTTTTTTTTSTTTTAAPPPRPRRPIKSSGEAYKACQRYRSIEEQRIGWFILGGEDVAEGEFPHMAALGYLRQGQSTISWRCGGSLVSERYVLTAAHCLTDRNAGVPKLVRVGEVDLRPAAGGPGDYAVERAVLHPRYKRKFNYDDAALLRLAAPVAFSQNVRPACLPAPGERPRGALIATGWGATESLGVAPSPVLLKTNLTDVPLAECRALHRTSPRIPDGISDDMLCAGDPRGIADTCVGDSGGPLQVQEDPRSSVHTVVGVTSFGPDPCGGKKPGVYVRVASYVPWIESVVWE